MISLTLVFYLFVVVAGVIGLMRGWAKELLVSFSVILSLAFTTLLHNFVPPIKGMDAHSPQLFWVRTIVLLVLVFFGYQTVYIPRVASKAARERMQDSILGFITGGLNGYLIFGTLWFNMREAGYPFAAISAPPPEMADAVERLFIFMPPNLLGDPGIYFAVMVAFIFVLVVYI